MAQVAESLSYRRPAIPVVSTLSGQVTDELATPQYWIRQARETVRFANAVRHLADCGVSRFLELGPDAVLSALGEQVASGAVFAPTMRRGAPEEPVVVTAVAQLHASGGTVDWSDSTPARCPPGKPPDVSLPAAPALGT